eukprot:TRINITY_DN2443_c0_g1_i1.p1 TRINITY_DN2443_c0_g1~~TRINITY_DN2443_c0_g1_i1.p1  ORF type:complete len:173 (+),score=12.10 TRINITY_DN2443_c0_g1_i1:56-574(+)
MQNPTSLIIFVIFGLLISVSLAQTSCPDQTTDCGTRGEVKLCCPYSRAVCCQDGAHCCPSGYQCDLQSSECYLSKRAISHTESRGINLAKLFRVLPDTVCPDGTRCGADETCCSIPDAYACCGFPQATCCSDKANCCPFGYRCDLRGGSCVKNSADDSGKTQSEAFFSLLPK